MSTVYSCFLTSVYFSRAGFVQVGMRAYSQDLREKIAAACQQPGRRQYAVAVQFGVSLSFVAKLMRRHRDTASVAAKPPGRGGPPRCLDAAAQAWLVTQVKRQPDATLAELRDALAAETGRHVSVGAVWRVLDEQGLRRKKKPARGRAHHRPGA